MDMSNDTVPTGGTTPPTEAPVVDNAAFAAMRKALDAQTAKTAALETEKAELAAKNKAFEDASKTELERLKEQASEADKLRDENGRFTTATQKLYEAALAGVSEEKREAVAALSASGNYAERLALLQSATALIGVAAPPAANAGTGAAPARGNLPGNVPAPELPKTFEEINKLSWGDALRGHAPKMPPDPMEGR